MMFNPVHLNVVNSADLCSILKGTLDYKYYFLSFEEFVLDDLVESFGKEEFVFKFSEYLSVNKNIGVKDTNLVHYLIELDGNINETKLLMGFEQKKRNQVRKSLSFDFEILEERLSYNNIDEIYKFYLINMARHGTKPKDKNYFINLIDKQCQIISLRAKDGVLAAVNIFIEAYPYCIVLFNLSNTDFWKYNINDRIYFESIKSYSKRNFKLFDFGSSLVSDINHNRYKEQFGAEGHKILKVERLLINSKIKGYIRYNMWRAKAKVHRQLEKIFGK